MKKDILYKVALNFNRSFISTDSVKDALKNFKEKGGQLGRFNSLPTSFSNKLNAINVRKSSLLSKVKDFFTGKVESPRASFMHEYGHFLSNANMNKANRSAINRSYSNIGQTFFNKIRSNRVLGEEQRANFNALKNIKTMPERSAYIKNIKPYTGTYGFMNNVSNYFNKSKTERPGILKGLFQGGIGSWLKRKDIRVGANTPYPFK